MAKEELIKTGGVYYIDEEGRLCYAESFIDANGVSSVKVTIVENTVVEVVGE